MDKQSPPVTRRPAFQFYPSDWWKDTGLRVCSLVSRGLWIEMMAIMHDGEPYGHLTVQGTPLDVAQLARMVGGSPRLVAKCLEELGEHKVFSRTELGVIYSRRMVRDEHLRNVRAAAGKLGGNPALKDGAKDNPKVGGLDNHQLKQKPTPSSSSAVASSTATTELQPPLQKPSRVSRKRLREAAGPLTTWLTPAAAAWEAANGSGTFAVVAKQAARELAPLRKAHTDDEIGRRLAFYLEMRGDAQGHDKAPIRRGTTGWAPNLRTFAATFGNWNPDDGAVAA